MVEARPDRAVSSAPWIYYLPAFPSATNELTLNANPTCQQGSRSQGTHACISFVVREEHFHHIKWQIYKYYQYY